MIAAERGAWICFQDEAGHTLRPPKARTWGRRGQTPVIPVSAKGSGRISVAGLICVKPGHRTRLLYRIKVHRARKGERRSFNLAANRDWLHVIQLPAYAPDLNPTEAVWSHVKRSLGNLATTGVDHLAAVIRNRLNRIQYRPDLLTSFLAHTGLTLDPEPP